MICGIGSKIAAQSDVKAAAAQLKSWSRQARGTLRLLMALTIADACCLCAFYAVIVYCWAPVVLAQDTTALSFGFYALLPLGGRLLLRLAMAKVVASLSFHLEIAIREELLRKLLRVGPLSLAVNASLSTLLVDALDDIMPYFTSFLVSLRDVMILPVICLICIALASPRSALILLVIAPLVPLFMMWIGKGAERLNQRQWRQITRMALRFNEALDKLSFLKLFNLERQEIAQLALLTKRWRVETMQVLRVAFLSALVLEFFATCGIAFCAVTLGFAVYEQGFSYTCALFVLLLAPEFFLPLRRMGLTYHARMRALGAMSSLVALLHAPEVLPEPCLHAESPKGTAEKASCAAQDASRGTVSTIKPKEPNNPTSTAHTENTVYTTYPAHTEHQIHTENTCCCKGTNAVATPANALAPSVSSVAAVPTSAVAATTVPSAAAVPPAQSTDGWLQAPFTITLQQVTAYYPNGRLGVANVSACIRPNEITALIGPSGAGKSTILQTIAGFTQIRSGRIVVNGHACTPDDLWRLMPHIAYIPQLPNLFFGTLRDNLKLGAPEASDAELLQALEQVGAGDLLQRLPDGLEHHVGEQNRGISGGEARLLALARAVVQQREILLLDEPTASIDRESEERCLQALHKLFANKTVLLVAHRPELKAMAQQLISVLPPVPMAAAATANTADASVTDTPAVATDSTDIADVTATTTDTVTTAATDSAGTSAANANSATASVAALPQAQEPRTLKAGEERS